MKTSADKIRDGIAAQFEAHTREMLYGATTASEPQDEEPFTIEKLKQVMRDIGRPPPEVRLSKHVPAMGAMRGKASPVTDDMRQMVEDMGEQRGPVAWTFKYEDREMVFINPINLGNR